MNVNNQTQAVLLLTTYFGKPTKDEPKPLSPIEWGRLAHWLKEHEILPEVLLRQNPAGVLTGWVDRTITPGRIRHLLDRAGALGLAVERWTRAGLWVMTRADPAYPARLKKRLGTDSPPVLFGCGKRDLLSLDGIAIVGSRHAGEQDLAFTSRLGSEVAMQGLSVVSGGARGVDEAAMLGALAREGTAVGVLSDSLLRAATFAKYRTALMARNLVLVSPFHPDAGFDVGNAMARNKYIYCLADAAIVIAASRERGGTWNGAVENLKRGWVPLWVKSHQDPASGNSGLVKHGAHWLPDGEPSTLSVRDLIGPAERPTRSLLDELARQSSVADGSTEYRPEPANADLSAASSELRESRRGYDLFLCRLNQLTAEAPVTQKQLLESGDISKSQLRDWLKRAVYEGHVRKLRGPVRYEREPQRGLFDDAIPVREDDGVGKPS